MSPGKPRWPDNPVGWLSRSIFPGDLPESESVPIFTSLARHVSADALDRYVAQLEKEINKYLTKDINYGKCQTHVQRFSSGWTV
jgi:hypothetical protein